MPYSATSALPSQYQQFNNIYQYNNNGLVKALKNLKFYIIFRYNPMLAQSHLPDYAQMMNQQQIMNQNYQGPIQPHQQHYSSSLQTSHAQPTQPLNLQTQQAQQQILSNVVSVPPIVQPSKKKCILRIEDPETKTLINSQDLEGLFCQTFSF